MWNIASTALGLTGIFLAIYFYFKSKPHSAIAFSKRSFSLLGESTTSLKDFSATYQGGSLTSLSASKVMLWNDGNTTISRSDIAESEKLSVSLSANDKILEIRILSVSGKSNGVVATNRGNNTALLDFDYLDPGQGVVLSMLHIGDDSNIEIKGILKGGSVYKYSVPMWPTYIGYLVLILVIILIILMIFNTLLDWVGISLLFSIAILLGSQIIGIFFLSGKHLFLWKRSQKELNTAFEEDFSPIEMQG